MEQEGPQAAGLDDVPQGLEEFAQRVIALRSVFAQESEVEGQELPLGVRDVA